MKAKQLILELRELVKEYGDHEVTISDDCGTYEVQFVKAYDENGRGPKRETFKGVKRFHIH